jgi:Bacterial membrane protein YfhO
MRIPVGRSTIAFSGLAAIVAVTFADLLSADAIPVYRDLLVFVAPFKHFLGERLRSGQLPLWNPYVYMGTPFLASLQSGVFYPPSALLLLPFPLGFNLFLLAHYCIAVTGFWLFSRRLVESDAAAAVGAMTFALGGYLVSTLSVTNHLQSAAWSPWAFALWTRRVDGGDRAQPDAALAVVLSLVLLGGAPEVFIMTLFMMTAWALYRTLPAFSALGTATLALVATIGLVALLTAFQTLPTIEYVSQSDRSGALGYGATSAWSLEPVSLLQLMFPYSAVDAASTAHVATFEATEPWLRSIYLGIATLCLIAAGAASARDRGYWGLLMVSFLLLALGRHTPLFRAAYDAFPSVMGKFRFPQKFLFVAHVSAAMMAARGVEACLRADRSALRGALAAATTFIVLALAVVLLRRLWPAIYLQAIAVLSGRFEPMTTFVPLALQLAEGARRALTILGVLAVLLLLRGASMVGPAAFATILVAIVAFDVVTAHHRSYAFTSWSELWSTPPLIDVAELRRDHRRLFPYQTFSDPLPDQAPQPINGLEHWQFVRDYPEAGLGGPQLLWKIQLLDLPMALQFGTLGGFDGINRRSDNVLRAVLRIVPKDRAVQLLRIFGTGALIGPTALEARDLEPLASTRAMPIFAYRTKDPAPAVYFASRLIRVNSDVEAFDRMIAPGFRPGIDVALEELPAGWREGEDENAPGSIKPLEWRAESIRLRATSSKDAFLVFNESYFPGWEARVDGVPRRIFRTNALVQGIVVPAGDHDVELVYRPRSFRIGTFLSMFGVVMLVARVAWSRRRRPR